MDAENKSSTDQYRDHLGDNSRGEGKGRTSEIVIIDDRSCIREAIASSLLRQSNKEIVSIETTDDFTASESNKNKPCEQLIILCDGRREVESIEHEISCLKECNQNAKLVLLSDHSSEKIIPFLLEDRSVSVIPSYYSTGQLMACIQVVESGIRYFPIEFMQYTGSQKSEPSLHHSNELSTMLTPRQREVMEYIFKGRSNKYIAAELSVSESTIKVHVHDAMKRLGATSRTHATYLLNLRQDVCL